ncbi:MAG: glutathione S-transferase family protein [Pseudomonadota bacterium]
MIEFWGRKNAYNVQKVFWGLQELAIDYQHHDVGSQPGELDTPDFRSINPHGRVPVIRDGAGIVWESNTILRYLYARYGNNELSTPLQKSLAERWMDWELTKLQPDFIDLFWGFYRQPESQHNSAQIERSKNNCEAHFQILDEHLRDQPYLAGEHFSCADISCAVCLYRYFNMGLAVTHPERVMQWYERLASRQAFQESVMQPFDELKGRVNF